MIRSAAKDNATSGNGTGERSLEDIEVAANQPLSSLRPPDRRRPRSRITFSFASSLVSSMNSAGSAQSSLRTELSEARDGDSRRSSLDPEMIDEEESDDYGHHRSHSQESVTSSDSQRSTSGSSKILRLFSSQSKDGELDSSATAAALAAKRTRISAFRRYGVGDYVLISNHDLPDDSSKLVNIHGFAEWDAGEALTSGEERGPYIYVLAQVKNVHFIENLPFYTVTRIDSGEDQRADVGK